MARLAGMRWREWLKYAGENGWFYSSANNVALSCVARKLMGVCLALMKEGRPYEPAPPAHHRPGHLKEADS